MSSDVYARFAPFITEYIYRHGWEGLRPVQTEAAHVIFDTDNNLLLSSGTASGKTEAALFPIISLLSEEELSSFGCLYIAPLKSLINDQFGRIDELLDLSGIPVYHWHGDVAASHKTRALREPRGILQITPESLESMLMNRSNDIPRLFGQLRFVVIDEIHVLMGSDRGSQIIAQLSRIARLIGHHPRRVGLSATVGDLPTAAAWLGAGTGRRTDAPYFRDERTKWRLGLEHFYNTDTGRLESEDALAAAYEAERRAQESAGDPNIGSAAAGEGDNGGSETSENEDGEPRRTRPEPAQAMLDPGYEYLYDCTKGKKCIVFSNSREETEYVTATLRQIADYRGEPDRFLIHHGNLSAQLREEAELRMKNDEEDVVTCATVTMELGIDICRLERVLQMGSPVSVSSLLQRIGRSGRRGGVPEMMMVFREDVPLPNTPLPQLIPWELIRAIAIIQLYIEERFIEPPSLKKLPMSLLFQQTLSVLTAAGSLTPRALAERVLPLPPFASVSRDDYKELLVSMIKGDWLEMTEERELIVGLRGERLTSSFKFYAVFKDSEDYTVRCGSDEIGTITTPPPVGDRFALAGRVWEVEELDNTRKLIYVKPVAGKMPIEWPGDYGEIHTRILRRMRRVLEEDTVYPYLKKNARDRIAAARDCARRTGMLRRSLVHLGGYTWCLFPWLGTRSFRTLRRFISEATPARFGLSGIDFEDCCYITFKLQSGDARGLCAHWASVASAGINAEVLVPHGYAPSFDKYDGALPPDLLRRAYAADRLRTDELEARLYELYSEFGGG